MFVNPPAMERLAANPLYTEADLYQARFTASLCPPAQQNRVAVLTALVSAAVRQGHVCLDLRDPQTLSRLADLGEDDPDTASWLDSRVITPANGAGPLILQGQRLYFAHFFRDESFVGQAILRLLDAPAPDLKIDLDTLEPLRGDDGQIDWQAVAILVALTQRFSVISGGPGTGKTHTMARLLGLLAQINPEARIALAAPTGKAASRMTESLSKILGHGLSHKAQTVHRLLGWQPGGKFRRHRNNPLAVDYLMVDEVSMLDLELAARLLEALPEHAGLIFLGDHNQLASVEAGAVLANLCQPEAINQFSQTFAHPCKDLTGTTLPLATAPGPLTDHVLELCKNWRFGPDSGIATLSQLIRKGEAHQAVDFLRQSHADLRLESSMGQADLREFLAPLVRLAWGKLSTIDDPAQALALFDKLRLLSPVRQGPRGTVALNQFIRNLLFDSCRETSIWYAGRPVMILENNYNLELFNGDVGLTLLDQDQLRVFFPGPEGFISFSPARLPHHETCYAMTVHKSQGSEFDHTVLVIPEEPCQVLGRELLYTALTRARQQFTCVGHPEQIMAAINTSARRDSGLGDMLRKAAGCQESKTSSQVDKADSTIY